MIASRTARQLGWLAIDPEHQRALRLSAVFMMVASRARNRMPYGRRQTPGCWFAGRKEAWTSAVFCRVIRVASASRIGSWL